IASSLVSSFRSSVDMRRSTDFQLEVIRSTSSPRSSTRAWRSESRSPSMRSSRRITWFVRPRISARLRPTGRTCSCSPSTTACSIFAGIVASSSAAVCASSSTCARARSSTASTAAASGRPSAASRSRSRAFSIASSVIGGERRTAVGWHSVRDGDGGAGRAAPRHWPRVQRGRARAGHDSPARPAVRPARRRSRGGARRAAGWLARGRGSCGRRPRPEPDADRRRLCPRRRGRRRPRLAGGARRRGVARRVRSAARARVKAAELDYELPPELIAQTPLERRDSSRLLVHDRATGETRHRRFDQLAEELPAGTLVVVNDTRVLPARLRLERPGGGEAEVLLLERLGQNGLWEGLARPSRKLRPGQRLGPVELVEPLGEGRWRLRVEGEPAGETPLPPYITEPLEDSERYQTVYAEKEGSAAAPTAGLHFTPELLKRLAVERVTLHVGLDTFRPISADDLSEHRLHSERYA